jgi:group I intron endonuclease
MCKTYQIHEVGPYGVIYCLTSPSGKKYIGQSWHIYKRLQDYKSLYGRIKNQIKLFNALKKYGSDNFTFEIIDLCENQSEMDRKEQFYIMDVYDSMNSGYNCTEGGSKGKISLETRNKMSKAQSGENNAFYGKQHSNKTKEHLRKINTGKKLSNEIKEKMKNAQKGEKSWCYGIPRSEETKNKIRQKNENFRSDPNNKEYIDKIKRQDIYKIWFNEKYCFITNNRTEFCNMFSLSSRILKSTKENKYNGYWHIEKYVNRKENLELYEKTYDQYIRDNKWKNIEKSILDEIQEKCKIRDLFNKEKGYGHKK